jgi:galactonate dehydratase
VVENPWKNWSYVWLETEEGLHGIGVGTLNDFAKTVESAIPVHTLASPASKVQ